MKRSGVAWWGEVEGSIVFELVEFRVPWIGSKVCMNERMYYLGNKYISKIRINSSMVCKSSN